MKGKHIQEISLKDLFATLISVNAAVSSVAGINSWRVPTGKIRLQHFDEELAQEIPYAPSKNVGNNKSVWAQLHFGILFPVLKKIGQMASQSSLEKIVFSEEEARKYFRFLDDLRQHLDAHQKYIELLNAIFSELSSEAKELPKNLAKMGKYRGSVDCFLTGMIFHLPESPVALCEALQGLERMGNKESHLTLWKSWLGCLPSDINDLHPCLKDLLKAARRNDILGRIIQSYYADVYGYSYEELGIPSQAHIYYMEKSVSKKEQEVSGAPTLHQRTLEYFCRELSSCPISPTGDVTSSEMISLYSSWYRSPRVVEMVTASFAGAAEEAAECIVQLMEDIYKLSEEQLDLRKVIFTTNHLCSGDLLRRLGRLTMIMDVLSGGLDCHLSGKELRKLATKIWSSEDRVQMWGQSNQYFPGDWQAFPQFCQDIAALVYAAALYLEDCQEESRLEGNGEEDVAEKGRSEALKYLAGLIKGSSHYKEMKRLLGAHRETLLSSSAMNVPILQTISMSFGLCKPQPIAIPLAEILRGLPWLVYRDNVLQIQYQEGEEQGTWEIRIPPSSEQSPKVRCFNQIVEEDKIPYPDGYELFWPDGASILLPKVGRESYDLCGQSESAHAGEVIGYGCSVFHSTLQLVQVIAALLGGREQVLEEIRAHFFSLNAQFHHRYYLAKYQSAQILEAIGKRRKLSYPRWITRHFKNSFSLLNAQEYAHTQAFLTSIENDESANFSFYGKRLACLGIRNPKLYPYCPKAKRKLSPRASFYDGREVILTSKCVVELPSFLSNFLAK